MNVPMKRRSELGAGEHSLSRNMMCGSEHICPKDLEGEHGSGARVKAMHA